MSKIAKIDIPENAKYTLAEYKKAIVAQERLKTLYLSKRLNESQKNVYVLENIVLVHILRQKLFWSFKKINQVIRDVSQQLIYTVYKDYYNLISQMTDDAEDIEKAYRKIKKDTPSVITDEYVRRGKTDKEIEIENLTKEIPTEVIESGRDIQERIIQEYTGFNKDKYLHVAKHLLLVDYLRVYKGMTILQINLILFDRVFCMNTIRTVYEKYIKEKYKETSEEERELGLLRYSKGKIVRDKYEEIRKARMEKTPWKVICRTILEGCEMELYDIRKMCERIARQRKVAEGGNGGGDMLLFE